MNQHHLLYILLLLSLTFYQTEKFKDYECINTTKEDAFKKILYHWSQFATEHNITYSISDGTLLGWYRNHQEFIGYDGDMDTLITSEGADTLNTLAANPSYPHILFTKDLKDHQWRPDQWIILVIYKNHYVSCDGTRTEKYTGTCSLGIPRYGGAELHGRVIYNNSKQMNYDS